jgi:RNA polymerase sigma factor (sigma-70 family)
MAESSERLLIENLPLLEQIIESLCARRRMHADEIEEFAAEVKLRLVNHDYAILKAYAGRSSLKTYLAAVVSRLLLDYRNQQWGKWRHSANAQHLGPVAVALERLLYRDKKTLDEAFVALAPEYPSLTRAELEGLAEQLRPRASRKMVSIEEAAPVATPTSGTDIETDDTASQISSVVCKYLGELPKEDQLIFRLRFHSDLTVREIATSLHLDPQKVFRRLYKHYGALKIRLTDAGIHAADVEQLIGTDTTLLDFHLKNRGVRPSDEESGLDVREENSSS